MKKIFFSFLILAIFFSPILVQGKVIPLGDKTTKPNELSGGNDCPPEEPEEPDPE